MPIRHRGEVDEWLHTFLTSALGEVELSTPRLRPLHAGENSPHYPLHRSLGSSLTRFGSLGVEIHLLPLMGFELRIVTLLLYSLRYSGSCTLLSKVIKSN